MKEPVIEWVEIDEVKKNPDNPRTITDEEMDRLMESLQKFPKMMEYRPILVDPETGHIIGGNQRHEAASRLGWERVPVIYIRDGASRDKLREMVLKDNMNYGEWDFEKLRENFVQTDLIGWGLEDAKYVSFDDEDDEEFDEETEPAETNGGGAAVEEGYEENQIRKIVFNLNSEEYDHALDQLLSYNQKHGLADNSQALLFLLDWHDKRPRHAQTKKQTINYVIAIPSYRREETLKEKTLAYLKRSNVPESKIYIFVANDQEMATYREAVGGGYNYVLGQETLRAQRNFIQNYFKEGDFVISMDDDLEGLYKLSGGGIEEENDIDKIAKIGYENMIKSGAKIFGVYPVANHFFMKSRVTNDLKYIVGCFWGAIIDHSENLSVELEDKEDFERSIRYFKEHGSVIRLDGYCVKTNYYKEKGGMQETRTKDRVESSARHLVDKYPEFCRINTRKKNKEFVEIELKLSK